MKVWEKAQDGFIYDTNYDKEIVKNRIWCVDLYHAFNKCKPSDI